ncbi:unnamed protein product [Moneuplotes crassus]|uniref:VTT domain-containing protein n=1 Tax=Euplotes crassus TaxID=5936 RepID=A0AAD1XSH0_EUPCR|nr:unnamed protein product [Moneuplotes crassus]
MTKEITQEDIEKLKKETQKDFKKNATWLAVLFVIFASIIFYVIMSLPSFTQKERDILFRIPREGKDLDQMSKVIMSYSDTNYYTMLAAFVCLYLFLQTFSIPGPTILSILSGALFGGVKGTCIVSVSATMGASMAYCVSWTLGKPLVVRLIPGAIIKFSSMVKEHRHNVLSYLLFLRITPLLPSIIINISSPILGIPLPTFMFATFVGLIPVNIVHCRTGLILSEISQLGGTSILQIFWLFVIGGIALIPTLFKKKLEDKFDQVTHAKENQKKDD